MRQSSYPGSHGQNRTVPSKHQQPFTQKQSSLFSSKSHLGTVAKQNSKIQSSYLDSHGQTTPQESPIVSRINSSHLTSQKTNPLTFQKNLSHFAQMPSSRAYPSNPQNWKIQKNPPPPKNPPFFRPDKIAEAVLYLRGLQKAPCQFSFLNYYYYFLEGKIIKSGKFINLIAQMIVEWQKNLDNQSFNYSMDISDDPFRPINAPVITRTTSEVRVKTTNQMQGFLIKINNSSLLGSHNPIHPPTSLEIVNSAASREYGYFDNNKPSKLQEYLQACEAENSTVYLLIGVRQRICWPSYHVIGRYLDVTHYGEKAKWEAEDIDMGRK